MPTPRFSPSFYASKIKFSQLKPWWTKVMSKIEEVTYHSRYHTFENRIKHELRFPCEDRSLVWYLVCRCGSRSTRNLQCTLALHYSTRNIFSGIRISCRCTCERVRTMAPPWNSSVVYSLLYFWPYWFIIRSPACYGSKRRYNSHYRFGPWQNTRSTVLGSRF